MSLQARWTHGGAKNWPLSCCSCELIQTRGTNGPSSWPVSSKWAQFQKPRKPLRKLRAFSTGRSRFKFGLHPRFGSMIFCLLFIQELEFEKGKRLRSCSVRHLGQTLIYLCDGVQLSSSSRLSFMSQISHWLWNQSYKSHLAWRGKPQHKSPSTWSVSPVGFGSSFAVIFSLKESC